MFKLVLEKAEEPEIKLGELILFQVYLENLPNNNNNNKPYAGQ